MVLSIRHKFASPNANLSDLHTAAICVTAFAGFLRFNELANLRCCDVKFCKDKYLNYLLLRVRLIFTEMEMLCWLRLGILLGRIIC